MAFDMGFNFRGSSGYVTDPAYGVPAIGEAYPHTYTNANGFSINAGWDVAASALDYQNTNDPRIAGINYDGASKTFTVDLSSGSAPGAGAYTVDIGMGGYLGTDIYGYTLKDNTTTLIDATNGGAGFTVLVDHYIDATVTDITATTTWTGTAVSKTFASTTVNLVCMIGSGGVFFHLAHFRLTLAGGGGGSVATRSMLMLMGVGA